MGPSAFGGPFARVPHSPAHGVAGGGRGRLRVPQCWKLVTPVAGGGGGQLHDFLMERGRKSVPGFVSCWTRQMANLSGLACFSVGLTPHLTLFSPQSGVLPSTSATRWRSPKETPSSTKQVRKIGRHFMKQVFAFGVWFAGHSLQGRAQQSSGCGSQSHSVPKQREQVGSHRRENYAFSSSPYVIPCFFL